MRTGSLDSSSSTSSFIRPLTCSPSQTRLFQSSVLRPLEITPASSSADLEKRRSPSSPCPDRRSSRSPRPVSPRSPRLSRSPSPHPVKNQRCSSQPNQQSRPSVAVVVSNLRKRSMSGVSEAVSSVRRSIKRLSPQPSIMKTPSPSHSHDSNSPVSQSRNTSPRTPGRVQFSPSPRSSRKSSLSPRSCLRTPSPNLSVTF